MALFPTAYFPCISYMARLIEDPSPMVEVNDTYHKQTYRNRCRVMTANGVENLSVPVVKVNGNHTMTKDVAISHVEPWQHIHSRCLESAYKAAPYFDHYYDFLKPVFESRFDKLIDLNDTALKAVLKMLKIQKDITHTSDYEKNAEDDWRERISPKAIPNPSLFPNYYQVFSTKHPFAPDLSILDLVFNEGPDSVSYLQHYLLNC